MVFRSVARSESVFDPLAGNVIAEFVDNAFASEDGAVCKRLIELGYVPEEVKPEIESVQPEPKPKRQYRKAAK